MTLPLNSTHKAALLGVPLVVAGLSFIACLASVADPELRERSLARYIAILAGTPLSLAVAVASLRAIMHLDRPHGLKATVAFKYLDIKETLKIVFLWLCASFSGTVVLGVLVSDSPSALVFLLIAPIIWFRSVQSLKCRAFFIHPDDRRSSRS